MIAAALRSSPILSLSSTALTATESMNSSIAGRIFEVMAVTASQAPGHCREGRDHGAGRVLGRQESQGHLGDHSEGPFAADE